MFIKTLTSIALFTATLATAPNGCSSEISNELSKVSEAIQEIDKVLDELDIEENTPSEMDTEISEKSKDRLIELPGKMRGVPERIISHYAYTLSFNRENNQPNWVAWELTSKETVGDIGRSNEFIPDPDVPYPHQVTSDDYRNSGYDRGHMAPAADMKWSQSDKDYIGPSRKYRKVSGWWG